MIILFFDRKHTNYIKYNHMLHHALIYKLEGAFERGNVSYKLQNSPAATRLIEPTLSLKSVDSGADFITVPNI